MRNGVETFKAGPYPQKKPSHTDNCCLTELGITHCNPKKLKAKTQRFLATVEWRSKWYVVSTPFFAHKASVDQDFTPLL